MRFSALECFVRAFLLIIFIAPVTADATALQGRTPLEIEYTKDKLKKYYGSEFDHKVGSYRPNFSNVINLQTARFASSVVDLPSDCDGLMLQAEIKANQQATQKLDITTQEGVDVAVPWRVVEAINSFAFVSSSLVNVIEGDIEKELSNNYIKISVQLDNLQKNVESLIGSSTHLDAHLAEWVMGTAYWKVEYIKDKLTNAYVGIFDSHIGLLTSKCDNMIKLMRRKIDNLEEKCHAYMMDLVYRND